MKSILDEIIELKNNGTLDRLFKVGFITSTIFFHLDIYLWVDAQVKIRGITKNQAVLEAEVKFNKDERTIWRALKSFQP